MEGSYEGLSTEIDIRWMNPPDGGRGVKWSAVVGQHQQAVGSSLRERFSDRDAQEISEEHSSLRRLGKREMAGAGRTGLEVGVESAKGFLQPESVQGLKLLGPIPTVPIQSPDGAPDQRHGRECDGQANDQERDEQLAARLEAQAEGG